MKNLISLALILTAFAFTSCEKKNVEPSTTANEVSAANNESINVQYRVTASSGNFYVEYISLEKEGVKVTGVEIKKATFTHSFTWTTKQALKIKAYNSTPSSKEVLVEIYVDGVLFKSGLANASGAIAIAEGVYKK